MKKILFFVLTFCIHLYSSEVIASAGAIDSTFIQVRPGVGDGANDDVRAIAVQNDGKVIIGGDFTSYNGAVRYRIARVNADGTLDDTFNPGIGANNYVLTTSIQSDGKIIVGGYFTSYSMYGGSYLVRLNTDGTYDPFFRPQLNENVMASAIQSDGKIIIAGLFMSCNGKSMNHIARLNTDGTLDETFHPGTGANYYVSTIKIQNDGKIIIGGVFTKYDGKSISYLARLNSDGSLDDTFIPGTGVSFPTSVVSLQNDGKIVVCGYEARYGTDSKFSIVRLNPDGSNDPTFNPGIGANEGIFSMAVETDGKIFLAGSFTSYNGIARNHIARINADGTLDNTFDPGTGSDYILFATAAQTDGKVLVGGWLTSYNGTRRSHIARINTDGSIDKSFNTLIGTDEFVSSCVVQSDGKILVGGGFKSYYETPCNSLICLDENGKPDSTFKMGTGFNNAIQEIDLQPDGKILIGGNFSSYNGMIRNNIVRLNADGSLDTSFDPGTGLADAGEVMSGVYSITQQKDGKMFIAGSFGAYNGIPVYNLARINADGSLDQTFTLKFGAYDEISDVLIQEDGKIIIVGVFGVAHYSIARLNANGGIDYSFKLGIASGRVNTAVIQKDGKIIIGGWSTSFNGTPCNHIARINTDGSYDNTFNIGTGFDDNVTAITLQNDGKVIVSGWFSTYNGMPVSRVVRLNTDGSIDNSFSSGGINGSVATMALQQDGKVIIGGYFSGNDGVYINNLSRLLNNTVSAVNHVDEEDLTLSYNALSNEINIQTEWDGTISRLEIFNINGQTVASESFMKEISLSTNHLESGVYIVRLCNAESVISKKIFIK